MTKINFNEYQKKSRETYGEIKTHNNPIVYPTLGLVNEAGEVAGKVKKVFRDKKGVFDAEAVADIKDELGDVLWYFTQICTNLGLTLDEVAQGNIEKIMSRKTRGKLGGSGDKR